MSNVYGSSLGILKAVGFLTAVGALARTLVAFGRWRTAFRNRLAGIDARTHDEEGGP